MSGINARWRVIDRGRSKASPKPVYVGATGLAAHAIAAPPGWVRLSATRIAHAWLNRSPLSFADIYPDSGGIRKPLANRFRRDSSRCMIRAGFLDPESRSDLIDLGRDGSGAHRLARRANALVLLDDG
jgi:hypothetical protein